MVGHMRSHGEFRGKYHAPISMSSMIMVESIGFNPPHYAYLRPPMIQFMTLSMKDAGSDIGNKAKAGLQMMAVSPSEPLPCPTTMQVDSYALLWSVRGPKITMTSANTPGRQAICILRACSSTNSEISVEGAVRF